MPYNEAFYLEQVGPLLAADYVDAGRLVGDDPGWVVWPARVNENIHEGLTPDAALIKTRAEWRAALGFKPSPQPPPSRSARWTGALCIPNALPDGSRLWCPAYGSADDAGRAAIRAAYTARYPGGRFAYLCMGFPYGRDYAELADDAARVRRDLTELRSAGLEPVVCPTFVDRDRTKLSEGFLANLDLVTTIQAFWEGNQYLSPAEMQTVLLQLHAVAPTAELWIHFLAPHSAIGVYATEIDDWRWCQEHGVTGFLDQTDFFDDPVRSGQDVESNALRLAGHAGAVEPLNSSQRIPAAWAGLHLKTVAYEYQASRTYRHQRQEGAARLFGQRLMAHCPTAVGFCDGG